MPNRIHCLTLALFTFLLPFQFSFAQLQSPDTFLPHQLGEAFTPHFMLADYVAHVAASSNRVQMVQYGTTNEGRPLQLCFISTPENLAQLEEIRTNNLRRTGHLEGTVDENLDRAIVWLSYSVHGNEAAGSEASKEVLYQLANPQNASTSSWLENTIVILDPCLNPDGYDRYTSWHRRVSTTKLDPSTRTREHNEPWPGGRSNHYHFDLNRDWAWQTQIESQARIKIYRDWMPHIHADLHEMGVNSPYYFAPAARPFHDYVTDFQEEFQQFIGENHARYFDANGWLYFTREVFDLLYPSYGDTWPTFNGAIGMTYEQGGSGQAGRAVLMENGDTLSLKDRIDHHVTTSLSTVEVGSQRMEQLLDGFEDFYRQSRNNPKGTYTSFVIKAGESPYRLMALANLLEKNGIQYGQANKSGTLNGWNYFDGEEADFEIEEGDLVVTARQPNGLLAQVLLNPETQLEDSLTYDITAWSLPLAYGLEAAAFEQDLSGWQTEFQKTEYRSNPKVSAPPVGWVLSWHSAEHAKLLAALLQSQIQVRVANRAFELEGRTYPAGTLVINRADNKKVGKLNQTMAAFQEEYSIEITPVNTGLTSKGPDLGSGAFRLIKLPRIGVLSDEGVSPYSFGQIWHYFESTLEMPLHIFATNNIGNIDLDQLDILILPEGRYGINGNTGDQLDQWIQQGGQLIAIGYANQSLIGLKGVDLLLQENMSVDAANEEAMPNAYAESDRQSITYQIPGAIFRLEMDGSHPLTYGLPDPYFSLKTSSMAARPLSNQWNVGIISKDPYYQGFAGAQALKKIENTLVYGVQDKGRGNIIYLLDNPLYRGFWEVGKLLFANALFMVD